MQSEFIVCGCGCNGLLARLDERGRPRRFLVGHGTARSIEHRFWKAVRKTDTCWPWIGKKTCDGYGVFVSTREHRILKAHRYSWELHRGPIPAGLHVLHKCNLPACANPDHLYVGTNYQNMQDRKAAGHYGGQRNRGCLDTA